MTRSTATPRVAAVAPVPPVRGERGPGHLPGLDVDRRKANNVAARVALIMARVRGELSDSEVAERMAKL